MLESGRQRGAVATVCESGRWLARVAQAAGLRFRKRAACATEVHNLEDAPARSGFPLLIGA